MQIAIHARINFENHSILHINHTKEVNTTPQISNVNVVTFQRNKSTVGNSPVPCQPVYVGTRIPIAITATRTPAMASSRATLSVGETFAGSVMTSVGVVMTSVGVVMTSVGVVVTSVTELSVVDTGYRVVISCLTFIKLT